MLPQRPATEASPFHFQVRDRRVAGAQFHCEFRGSLETFSGGLANSWAKMVSRIANSGVNAARYVRVDYAETEEAECYRVNCGGVALLDAACARHAAPPMRSSV